MTEACITIKDHKSELPNKIPCHLIHSSKSSIGKISTVILDRINEKIISSVAKINEGIHQQLSNTIRRFPRRPNVHSYNLILRFFSIQYTWTYGKSYRVHKNHSRYTNS